MIYQYWSVNTDILPVNAKLPREAGSAVLRGNHRMEKCHESYGDY